MRTKAQTSEASHTKAQRHKGTEVRGDYDTPESFFSLILWKIREDMQNEAKPSNLCFLIFLCASVPLCLCVIIFEKYDQTLPATACFLRILPII